MQARGRKPERSRNWTTDCLVCQPQQSELYSENYGKRNKDFVGSNNMKFMFEYIPAVE